jgi:hypothetical protein
MYRCHTKISYHALILLHILDFILYKSDYLKNNEAQITYLFVFVLNIDYVKLNKKWNYSNVISPYYRLYYFDERIVKAQYLITSMNMPYTAIALETGFESLPYFSKVFKRITGITPGEYRRQHQKLNRLLWLVIK